MTTLPAGPELDRLVAEKVMGWKININEMNGIGICFDNERVIWADDNFLIDVSERETFNPSRDIAHAWEVAEKINGGMILAAPGSFPIGELTPNDSWLCDLTLLNKIAIADTAPHAICLAALAAVGHK